MVLSSSQQAELEARFSYLLQPIRDLTKNWDVDLASQLEDYLEEIGSIAVTFDGGATTLNFAEAALLIQGSACVYSRKVEYLHALVYQVLDLLSNKKKMAAPSVDADGVDQDVPRGLWDDEEFLSLDDIKVCKNIDLIEDLDGNAKEVAVLPEVTLSLMPLEEGERGDNPLLSHKGEVLGSRNDFKMNTCNMHPSGTLLLDLSHLNLLEFSFQNKPHSTPFVPKTVSQAAIDAVQTEDVDVPMDEGVPGDISMDDHHDDGLAPPPPDDLPEDPVEEMVVDKEGLQLRRSERNKNIVNKPPQKPTVDYWSHLDPHEEKTNEKAFKKKKTYKVVASVPKEDTKKRKRGKTATAVGKEQLTSLAKFCNDAFYSNVSKFPSNPLKVPMYPELETIYWAEHKKRRERVRQERKRLEEQGRLRDLEKEIMEEEEEEDNCLNDPGGADDDDDDDPVGPRIDFQIPEVNDLGPLQPDDDLLMADQGPGDMPVVGSYEELVRHHVEGYLASAQQFAQITDLSRRVAEWEEKILPKLQEEEEHGPFDIHAYGSTILSDLDRRTAKDQGDQDSPVTFRRICRNKPTHDVCRLFLASLQLANNYNVEISSDGSLATGMDTMSLRKLSSRRHFEELEEYRAPSHKS